VFHNRGHRVMLDTDLALAALYLPHAGLAARTVRLNLRYQSVTSDIPGPPALSCKTTQRE
jgi:hypothetical protein